MAVKIELYAILAAASVVGSGYLGDALLAAYSRADVLERLDESKSLLLRELTHAVANDFASIFGLIKMKSASVRDAGTVGGRGDRLLSRLAGALGFEPRNGGTKIRCLTTWLRPNRGLPSTRNLQPFQGGGRPRPPGRQHHG